MHGGDIKVTSKVNVGSRFSVTIPWQKARTIAISQSATAINQTDANKKQLEGFQAFSKLILLVEDNLINNDMLADFLRLMATG